jgi:hypothetical protein
VNLSKSRRITPWRVDTRVNSVPHPHEHRDTRVRVNGDAPSQMRSADRQAASVQPRAGRLLTTPHTTDLRAFRALGARAVALTCGSESVVMGSPDGEFTLPVPHIPDPVDATGAGDVFAGTLAARLALGDSLPEAAGLGRRRRFALSGRTRRNGPTSRRSQKREASRRLSRNPSADPARTECMRGSGLGRWP